ncbi:MAG: hypothetical protein H0W75_12235, partial [Chitinophagaceae bacterium]|nr:hypothetical protein [Chitinophagaceae bacterium]
TYLATKNYEVCDTYSLTEGLAQMRLYKPDILFLDNNLADGTGWPNLEKFYEINPSLKLFLMSGFQPPLPQQNGKDYKVLTKPISFNDLDSMLDKSAFAS